MSLLVIFSNFSNGSRSSSKSNSFSLRFFEVFDFIFFFVRVSKFYEIFVTISFANCGSELTLETLNILSLYFEGFAFK